MRQGCHNGSMSALKDRLRADLTTAMKARDELRSSTLRMVLTAITNAEVAGKEARELSDDDIIGVLLTEAKRRREAAVAFEEGGRAEMAAKEAAEGEVIAEYLPAQLSESEIADLVSAAIAQTGAADEGMRAMGKVMGVVTPQVKGRADGGAVAAEVRRLGRAGMSDLTSLDDLPQVHPFDILEDDVVQSLVFANVIDSGDVFVIEPSRGLSLVLKTTARFFVSSLGVGEDLERHDAIEHRVAGLENRPHAAAADKLEQLEMIERLAR